MFALETLTDSTVVTNLLDSLSGLSTLLIVGLFAMHLFAFFVLQVPFGLCPLDQSFCSYGRVKDTSQGGSLAS